VSAPALRLTRSAEETEALGAALARALPTPTPAPAVVHLSGDLGSGKTTFARGFLRARGLAGAVRSPTYTLLECYELPALTVVHLDLYRLRDPAELEALGVRDFALPNHVWLAEWPERGGGVLPRADILIALRVLADGHEVSGSSCSTFGASWLANAVEFSSART
jgi:tRNA threonylcarbamoyladenosine biosynthesis protein TsaE